MSQKKPPDSEPNARGARPGPVTTNPRLALVPIKQVAKGSDAPEKTAESTDPSGGSTDPNGQAPTNESTLLSSARGEPVPEATLGGLPNNESTLGGAPPLDEPQQEATLGAIPEPKPAAPRPRSMPSASLRAPEPPAPAPKPMPMPMPARAAPAAPPQAPPAPAKEPAARPGAPRAPTGQLRMVAASAEAKAEANPQRTGLLGTLSGLTFGKLMGRSGPGQPSQSAIFRLKQVAERRGFETIIAGVMVLLAIGVAAHFLAGPSKPSSDQLLLLYPYGASGARMPNGRTAPPATELSFDFKGTTPCGEEQCLRYEAATPNGAFTMEMVLQQRDGQWALYTNLGR